MSAVVITLSAVCAFLAASCGALLGARSFTKTQRTKYPLLRKLDGKQIHLGVGVFVFSFLSIGLAAYNQINTSGPLVYVPSDQDADRIADALMSRLAKRWPSTTRPTSTVPEVGGPAECVLLAADTSGSMRRFPVAQILLDFAGILRRRDAVGVMAFDERATIVLPFDDYRIAELQRTVAELRSIGRLTDLRQGIETAIGALRGASSCGRKRLVILTDAVVDTLINERLAPWKFNAIEGIAVDAIIVGREVSTDDARKLMPQLQRVWNWHAGELSVVPE